MSLNLEGPKRKKVKLIFGPQKYWFIRIFKMIYITRTDNYYNEKDDVLLKPNYDRNTV